MPNNQSLHDDEWFQLINGKHKAEPDKPAQQQAQTLRDAMLIEQITEQSLAAERATLLKRLSVLDTQPNQWQRYWQTYWQAITGYFKPSPQVVGYFSLASLIAIAIVMMPVIMNQQAGLDEARYIPRQSIESEAAPYRSEQPQLKAQEIKRAFEQQGLKVVLESQQAGWLLTTKLPLDLGDRKALLRLLEGYKIKLPIGSVKIRLLFVKDIEK